MDPGLAAVSSDIEAAWAAVGNKEGLNDRANTKHVLASLCGPLSVFPKLVTEHIASSRLEPILTGSKSSVWSDGPESGRSASSSSSNKAIGQGHYAGRIQTAIGIVGNTMTNALTAQLLSLDTCLKFVYSCNGQSVFVSFPAGVPSADAISSGK